VAERLVFLAGAGYATSLKKSIEEERKKLKDKGDFDPSKLIRSKHIAQAFRAHDDLVYRVVEESAELLGVAIGGVVTLLSMPHVVLGGGFTEALGEPWVRMVRKAVHEHVFPSDLKKVEVLGTALKENAGIIGAAILARENL
jgi:glucokinase